MKDYLYVKSNYSLLSSMLKIDDIINYSLNNNLSYASLTDINMFGTMEFINKCEANNLKPIIGLEINYKSDKVVCFAKDYIGYKGLLKLTSINCSREVSFDELVLNNSNLIYVVKNIELYRELNKSLKDLYIGYTSNREEREYLLETKNVLFFRECLYKENKDYQILEYLYRIRDSKTVNDEMDYDLFNHELYVDNIMDNTDNIGLLNMGKIINECNFHLEKDRLLLPIYDDTHGMDVASYLFELTKVGLKRRIGEITPKYQERLIYELNVINKMGFPNYFLVVYDFIKFAKKNDILVGPGRGSAAGSLVSYALGITDIDPLKYDLLFERFLNPARKTMPDIDTDFPDNKRDEVINYVTNKYGKKRVAGIVTFGTLGAKQVIRDVSRVLNIPVYKVDALNKYLPAFSKDKLSEFYKNDLAFKARIDSDNDLSRMYKIAVQIEGYPRHTSSHAAGIVMCSKDLDEVVPLTMSDGMYLSGYTMEYLENLGLLKMDFLGLKNLTIIDNILNDVLKNYNKKIDFKEIPLDDKEALSVFLNAETSGIFQFESVGMRNFLRKLKPNTFEDIFAAIALFRPGANNSIDSYIARKEGSEKVTYLDPSLEPILSNTYGIFIYQEQIMLAAQSFAGYSLAEADILRRAMSKKKVELLKQEEEKFISKAISNGKDEKVSKEIFDLILKFAGYGFNRSHSVAYSMIAYKMAYLKVHYKSEFFSNLLSNVIGSETKTIEYIREAKTNKILVEKPSINISDSKYIVNNSKIIFPISNIKSVGSVASSTVLKARKNGPFKDIYDAFSRLIVEGLTRKTFESLIYADVFREFGFNKKTLISNLDSLINYGELTKDIDPSLVMSPDIEIKEEFTREELLEYEKNVFGFYLSSHPTTFYKLNNPSCILLEEIPSHFNKIIDTLVLVERIKTIDTKKGDKMAFISGSDETNIMDFTLFPRTYQMYSNISKGSIIKVRGRVEKRLNQYQIIVDKIRVLNGEKNNEKE